MFKYTISGIRNLMHVERMSGGSNPLDIESQDLILSFLEVIDVSGIQKIHLGFMDQKNQDVMGFVQEPKIHPKNKYGKGYNIMAYIPKEWLKGFRGFQKTVAINNYWNNDTDEYDIEFEELSDAFIYTFGVAVYPYLCRTQEVDGFDYLDKDKCDSISANQFGVLLLEMKKNNIRTFMWDTANNLYKNLF